MFKLENRSKIFDWINNNSQQKLDLPKFNVSGETPYEYSEYNNIDTYSSGGELYNKIQSIRFKKNITIPSGSLKVGTSDDYLKFESYARSAANESPSIKLYHNDDFLLDIYSNDTWHDAYTHNSYFSFSADVDDEYLYLNFNEHYTSILENTLTTYQAAYDGWRKHDIYEPNSFSYLVSKINYTSLLFSWILMMYVGGISYIEVDKFNIDGEIYSVIKNAMLPIIIEEKNNILTCTGGSGGTFVIDSTAHYVAPHTDFVLQFGKCEFEMYDMVNTGNFITKIEQFPLPSFNFRVYEIDLFLDSTKFNKSFTYLVPVHQ